MLREFELNCILSQEASSRREIEIFIIEARKLRSQNKPSSSPVILLFRPWSWQDSKPLLGRHLPRMGVQACWMVLRVFGKLQTDDGFKDFSDHPLWRCPKEEMPGGMNMLSSLLLIATTDQQRLVISVTKLQFKKVLPYYEHSEPLYFSSSY